MTCPKVLLGVVMDRLTATGLVLKRVDLRGRFHSPIHEDQTRKLVTLCESHRDLRFQYTHTAAIPIRENVTGAHISPHELHRTVIEGILSKTCDWYSTYSAALSTQQGLRTPRILCFGMSRPIPRTPTEKGAGQQELLEQLDSGIPSARPSASYDYPKTISGDEIAVIGMACKVAGADDLEEFWDVLCRAESQHTQITDDFRFNFKTVFRESNDAKRKWYGNFITDVDAFDHKFWRKSPREAASTDPQQRLMMSVALQAVIQAGYFHASTLEDQHIGCYLGIGNVDYEENINCHEPTAFMATGNLRSFIAGKISHALGWTGPALTIDTACSSSGVAVHQACKAILSGECTAALAGGAAIMTSPRMFQDLAAASFLSPTGPCKSFDASADGYCRGDGVGAVFLKKLSQAIEDGDQIFGVVANTAVYQNQNSTAITVPNAKSLSGLFGDVAQKAKVAPSDVTYVEAHGTGTQVGDPAEFDGIRRVFGGSSRSDVVTVGSVKSVIGHTEGAAGIISLIKVLLMMHQATITAQANFKTINPSIGYDPKDKVEVAAAQQPWRSPFRAAMINSYGASGSNASIIVTQAPRPAAKLADHLLTPNVSRKYPFWFCGFDERAVQAYVAKFLGFLVAESLSKEGRSIPNLSFNVARQTNRWLPRALIFSVASTEELLVELSSYIDGRANEAAVTRTVIHPDTRPVILCFGGQVSNFVGLDKDIFSNVGIFRRNLEECDAICQASGIGSIFPDIFQREPIQDTMKLQVALFAMQYATAKCWIDCGLQISAVVGHSFGELTALCISGVLSLQHALQLIARRSRVIRDSWGPEKGAMFAVEGNHDDILKLLARSNDFCQGDPAATIACYNGPTSFTLAGSVKSMTCFEKIANEEASPLKLKRLNVTNAFHSTLVEPLMLDLLQLTDGLVFHEPIIPLERATEGSAGSAGSGIGSTFVADHLRNPVFFNHAVHRLSQRYPSAIWLEAGSNSTITSMAKRALGSPSTDHFQPMNLTSEGSWKHLVDATMKIWKEGINVPFWPHHSSETTDYSPLILPPYQFEKARHWLGRKLPPPPAIAAPIETTRMEEPERGLFSVVSSQDADGSSARFKLHTNSEDFKRHTTGAQYLDEPMVASIALQVRIVIEAHKILLGTGSHQTNVPRVYNYCSHAPLVIHPKKTYLLDTNLTNPGLQNWQWRIIEGDSASTTIYASGILQGPSSSQEEFQSFGRLINHDRCVALLKSLRVDAGMQGRNIYQLLGTIIRHDDEYKALQNVVSKKNECAARLTLKCASPESRSIVLADAIYQVSTLFLNRMIEGNSHDIFKPYKFEKWLSNIEQSAPESTFMEFDVLSTHHRLSAEAWIADVFIFHTDTGELLEVLSGLHLAQNTNTIKTTVATSSETYQPAPAKTVATGQPEPQAVVQPTVQPEAKQDQPDITDRVLDLLAGLSGLDTSEIKLDTNLPDIGIDSLTSMELARDIEKKFECTFDITDMNEVEDVNSLIRFIEKVLGIKTGQNNTASPSVATSKETTDTIYTPATSNGDGQMCLDLSIVWQTFQDTKVLTDDYVSKHGFAGYSTDVMPKQTELSIVHILDAFDQLGTPLRNTKPGDTLKRVPYHPRHERFVNFIYSNILAGSGLIKLEDSAIIRTDQSLPTRSAQAIFDELLSEAPEHAYDHRLTFLAGQRLAEVLADTCDGIQLLFSSPEGREAVTGMYSQSPVNVVWIKQMEDLVRSIVQRVPTQEDPLKIFELGAGTGGTTAKMVALLSALNVPVEYTVTDISPSLVAAARKRFKGHSFVKYQAYDIEKPPSENLLRSQHLIIATNCVHATHNLVRSTTNIRQLLRPDGFLLMLEMTTLIPWIDLVFGTLEGWWLFDDGREHALMDPEQWKKTLQSVGYGDVDWTSGARPESGIQRIIIAMAS